MVEETSLHPRDFIAPLFVVPGLSKKSEISSLVGQYHLSPDMICEEISELSRKGVNSVLFFGLPSYKDEVGSAAWDDQGVVQQALRLAKKNFPQVVLCVDLCFCEYTSHGHCGVLNGEVVDNDKTLVNLANQAISLAKAGADVIAPSGMMDGAVGHLRTALDAQGMVDTAIMGYSAKYASSFYGPFREAVESAPSFGDRKTYQMNPTNSDEAIREVAQDLEEGADIVMVKPALPYLDIIHRVKTEFRVPVAAYNVSGEYAMIKTAAAAGLIDGPKVMLESLISIKRAGADLIISYFAKEAADLLNKS